MKKHIIKIFEDVRDIPYRLRFSADDNDFSCDGKHRRLAELLIPLGYEVRPRTCLYKWESMPIPQSILKLDPAEFYLHRFLEILIGDRWVRIDVTWDRALGRIFPVNEWDGKSDTAIGVPYVGNIFSPEDSEFPEFDKEKVDANLKKRKIFHEAFNSWLDEIRKQK